MLPIQISADRARTILLFVSLTVFVFLCASCASVSEQNRGKADGDKQGAERVVDGVVGQWADGPSRAVAASGDWVYYEHGGHLSLAKIQKSGPPEPRAKVAIPGVFEGLAVADDHVYVANGENGLVIVDVSDPTAPQRRSTVSVEGSVQDVAAAGDYVYISEYQAALEFNGVRAIDVSEPSRPKKVGAVNSRGYTDGGINVVGRYVYLINGQDLWVFDASDPANLHKVRVEETRSFAKQLAVSGEYAYLVLNQQGVRVFNISSPSAPQRVKTLEIGGRHTRFMDIAVHGDHAYVTTLTYGDGVTGLRVLDVSAPYDPQVVGTAETGGHPIGVATTETKAFVAASAEGMHAIDVASPSEPKTAGVIETGHESEDVLVGRTHAYVANRGGGLRVLDVSDPSAPVETGRIDVGGAVSDAAKTGTVAAVADTRDSVHVVRFDEPGRPEVQGTVHPGGIVKDLAADAGWAYVAADDRGLRIVDIPASGRPRVAGDVTTDDIPVSAVAAAEKRVYIVVEDTDPEIRVVDVSTPDAPKEVAAVAPNGEHLEDLAVRDEYLYVAAADSGLRVVNVSESTRPREVGGVKFGEEAIQVTVAEDKAYVAGRQSLVVVDVSDPASPQVLRSISVGGATQELVAKEGYVYVADYSDGLYIL